MPDDDICGVTTDDTDEPCKLPPSRPDDRCHHHTTHEDMQDDPGRPTKLTKERQERIASAIEDGASIREASRKNGIHPETFIKWMERGEEQDAGLFAEFHERLTRARGEGESMYRSALIEIAVQNDDAATLMSMLKQRYPDSWGDAARGEQAAGVVIHTDADGNKTIKPDVDN